MDGNSPLCKCLIQATHQPADSPPCDWIPAVHAGMTGFDHLCITMSAGAWGPSQPGLRRWAVSSGLRWLGENAGFVPRGQTMKLSAHPTGLPGLRVIFHPLTASIDTAY